MWPSSCWTRASGPMSATGSSGRTFAKAPSGREAKPKRASAASRSWRIDSALFWTCGSRARRRAGGSFRLRRRAGTSSSPA
jgi:hypothetical protein